MPLIAFSAKSLCVGRMFSNFWLQYYTVLNVCSIIVLVVGFGVSDNSEHTFQLTRFAFLFKEAPFAIFLEGGFAFIDEKDISSSSSTEWLRATVSTELTAQTEFKT